MRYLILFSLLFLTIISAGQSVCCAPPDSCTQIWMDSIAKERARNVFDSTFPNAINKYANDSIKGKRKARFIRMWGQSNCGGMAPNSHLLDLPISNIPYNFRLPFNHVFIQNTAGNFVTLQAAVSNKKNDTSAFGAEIGIAYRYKLAFPNEYLFISKNFIDGANIWYFTPSSTFYKTTIPYYDSLAIVYWKNNNWNVTDDGVLWQQGESDFHQSKSWYRTRIDSIYTAINADKYFHSYSKFIISLIAPTSATYGVGVDSAFREFALANSNVRLINPPGTPFRSDSIHLSGIGEFMVAYRASEYFWDLDTMGVFSNYKSVKQLIRINGELPDNNGNIVLPSVGMGQYLQAKNYTDSLVAALLQKYKKDDSVYHFSGTLYYTRSGGVNTWHVRNDNANNIAYNIKDSVVVSGKFLDVYLKVNGTHFVPCGVTVSNGIVTNKVATSSGAYQLSLNGFNLGARILDDKRVRISVAQMMELQLLIQYDSASNNYSKQQLQPAPVNLANSYPPSITSGQDAKGHLWIRINTTGVFKPVKYPDIKDAKYDKVVDGKKLVLIPSNSEDNYFSVLDQNGNYINGSTPPNNSIFIINWGTVNGEADPSTADMGNQAEFGVTGDFKSW